MDTMDLDRLNSSINDLLKKLRYLEGQILYLRQRENKLSAANQKLLLKNHSVQTKLEDIIKRLKQVENTHEPR
jgi:ACT domain-containing protein